MQKIVQKRCPVQLSMLLLASVLLISCWFQGNVSVSTAHAATHSQRLPSLMQATHKLIVVNLSRQWLYAYVNGSEVYNTPVMTGRPELATPTGTYHVFAKFSPTTFYSPFPRGSSYWYPPTHIAYALEWKAGGYFLHDSWWHSVYGPGTNLRHYDPVYGWQPGSHGCIAMPLRAAAWLYHWAPIGTTVRIRA